MKDALKFALFNPIMLLIALTIIIGYLLAPIFAMFLNVNPNNADGAFNQWVSFIAAAPIAFFVVMYITKRYKLWGCE